MYFGAQCMLVAYMALCSTTTPPPSCSGPKIVSLHLLKRYRATLNSCSGQVIIISDIAIGTMIFLLGTWIYQTSWTNVWRLYFVPWLVSLSQPKSITAADAPPAVGTQLVIRPARLCVGEDAY